MPIETLQIHGVPLSVDFRRAITAPQRRVLVTTLELLPVPHLRLVPRIVIGDRPVSGGGAVPPNAAHGPLIRINVQRFSQDFNQECNQTLLHEIGHMMDYQYHCIDGFYLRRENRRALQYLRSLAGRYGGRTQGEREVYADAYAGLFRRKQNLFYNRHTRSYGIRWPETRDLYLAILRSPPFDCCRHEFDDFLQIHGRYSAADFDDHVVTAEPRGRRR